MIDSGCVTRQSMNQTNSFENHVSLKKRGKFYTPRFLVKIILDYAGYSVGQISCRHIIDNSCGDGAFLEEIVERYCDDFVRLRTVNGCFDAGLLAKELSTYIHGIEISKTECDKCKENLSAIAFKYGVVNVLWDVECSDAMLVSRFNRKMDFVVGNPPYVRVHNLENSYRAVKNFSFAQQGMTDLYIVFFELCFKMLSSVGKMCIITPSSWFTSNAGLSLRNYIKLHKNLSGIIDLEHFQAFNATTYTAISRFDKCEHSEIEYLTLNEDGLTPHGVLDYDDFIINNKFYFSDEERLLELKNIRNCSCKKYVTVKNGFATLADKVFINAFDFDDLIIDVVKASTGKWCKILYPYTCDGYPLTENELKRHEKAYSYLLNHKNYLMKRGKDENSSSWFLYGRTQAIKDVSKRKVAINTIIKDVRSIKLVEVSAGKGVYSGLYILTDLSFLQLSELIVCNDFIDYIKTLKNYKSGGYYTFSSKDLELYLNYKANEQFGFLKYTDELF